jgi:hypothetical protein
MDNFIPPIQRIIREYTIPHRKEWTRRLMKAVMQELWFLFHKRENERAEKPSNVSWIRFYSRVNTYGGLLSNYADKFNMVIRSICSCRAYTYDDLYKYMYNKPIYQRTTTEKYGRRECNCGIKL